MSWKEFKKKKEQEEANNINTSINSSQMSSWQKFKQEKETYNNSGTTKSSWQEFKDKEEGITSKLYQNEEEKENSWFKGSKLFDDGYQFGDVTRTTLSTVGDVGTNLVKGIARIGEGIGDAVSYGIADIYDWTGNDSRADQIRTRTQKNVIDSVFEPAENYLDKNSVLGEKSDSIAEGLGYVAGITAVGYFTGGVGVTATTFTNGMANGMTEALNNGASIGEARMYGAISGAGEAISELAFGGLGKASQAMGLSKGALDDVVIGGLTKNIKNKMVKTIMQSGLKATGEGLEEIVSGLISAAGKRFTYMDDKKYLEIVTDENLAEQFWMGTLTSAISQGPSTIRSVRTGTDYISGRTNNEQKVYDNEVKERTDAKVREATIEKAYNEQIKAQENLGIKITEDLKAELMQKVEKAYDNGTLKTTELRKKDVMKIRDEIEADMQEGNIPVENIMKTLGENQDISKDKILMKSMYENEQKYNSYKVEQTDNDKVNVLMQSAADAGMNNTSKTRKKVELISKLVKDTDRQYKFVSPEQLKQMGYNENANGLINKSTGEILINARSDKGLQSIVGHETTHIFDSKDKEGNYTKEYQILQDMAIEYAKTKGIYDGKVQSITSTYGDLLVDESQIKEELTADLVGDFLFNDEKFIENLAVKDRNVFQKIYDYIKHIYKVATSGTEEAKALENLKYQFDKVYKTVSVESNGDVKYSIGGKEGIKNAIKKDTGFLKLERDYNKAQQMQKNGTDNETIRKSTGWFQDKNGDWKFEFSDKDMSVRNIRYKEGKIYKLGSVLEHDTLFLLYPQLKDYNVVFKNIKSNGSFKKAESLIIINKNNLKSKTIVEGTLIHEIQHAIQNIEGFAEGRSSNFKLAYYESLGEIEAADTKRRYLLEKQGNLDRNAVEPESSKTNPEHPKLKDYLANRNIVDKMKDGLYNYFKERMSNENNKENMELSDEETSKIVFQNRQYADKLSWNGLGSQRGRLISEQIDIENTSKESENNSGSFYFDKNAKRYEDLQEANILRFNKRTDESINIEILNNDEIINQFTVTSIRNASRQLGDDISSYIYDNATENNKTIHLKKDEKVEDINISHKGKQLDIIKKTNPMLDDYHVGIRTVDDIKTFDEVLNDDESFAWGDFSREDAENALKTGKITIYSSYPIKQGTFISTSRIQAEEYAGGRGNKVYSKTIALDEVAWINGDEGQYANVADVKYSLRDNHDRILTKEQQEYFKDSKARDENGNLLEVYHGTSDDFAEFDISYLGSASGDVGFLGDGFYFATHKGEAKYYGNKIMNGYVNIKNPYNIQDLSKYNGKTFNGEDSSSGLHIKNLVELNPQWRNIEINNTTYGEIADEVTNYLENVKVKKLGIVEDSYGNDSGIMWEISFKGKKTHDESILNYTEEEMIANGLNKHIRNQFGYINNSEIIQYITEENRFNKTIKTLREVLQEKGYDSIVQGTPQTTDEIVIFNSNQFKNVDNINPTSNPNINLSLTSDIGITGDDVSVKELQKREKATIEDSIGNNLIETPTIEEVITQSEEQKQQGMKDKAKRYLSRSKTKFINKIVNDFGTSRIANTKTLNSVVDRIREDIQQNGPLSKEKADTYFDELYDNLVKIDSLYYDEYKEVKDNIRNTKLYISDSIKNNITDYNDFKKSNMGTLLMTSDSRNIPVDSYYQELSNLYPELFPSDILNPADQLSKISEVAKDITKVETNVAAYNDRYMGPDYRSWARASFDKDISDFTQDIKLANRYNISNNETIKFGVDKEIIKYAYKHLPNAKKVYEKAISNELLTKEDRLQVDRLLNNEIGPQDIPKGLNKKGIIKVAEAKLEYDSLQKAIKEYQTDIKSKRIEQARNDIGNLDLWKDKNIGFKYSRETPIRNIYDIAPKEIADTIANKYFRSYIEVNEKKVIDAINGYNERIKQLDIETKNKYKIQYMQAQQEDGNIKKEIVTKKVSESALVQLLGENKISIDEIQRSGADVSKIQSAVNEFRKIYNELIEQINESMLDNGYAPVEYRKDYFPHFTEEKVDTLLGKAAKLLGIDITNREELPTDIAGQTYQFKPGRTWFGNILQRTIDVTDYDALKGFDKYIRGATDLIYHTGDIQNLRALSTAIRGTYNDVEIQNKIEEIKESTMSDLDKASAIQEVYNAAKDKSHLSKFIEWLDNYTNLLAGKKAINDRGTEKELNRQVYKTMQDIESRIAANAIGGNIGVSLTNFSPLSQAWGEIKTTNLINGIWQTMKASLGNDTSFASESQFVTRRRGAETLSETTLNKLTKPLDNILQFADDFTSEVIVRSRYNQNLQEGMSSELALEEADRYAAGLMGDRGRGALPTQFSNKNPISKLINMFQVEVNNQWSYYLKDLPKNIQEKANNNKAKVVTDTAMAYTKVMVGAYLTNELLGSIRGQSTRVLPDPIYIIAELLKDLTDDDDENDDDAVIQTITEIAGNVPFISLPATLFADSLGLEVGDIGRISISGAIPNVSDITSDVIDVVNGEKTLGEGAKSIGEELLDTVGASLILPYGGSQIKKTVKGLSLFSNDIPGSYTNNGDLRYTVEDDVGSKVQSAIFGAYANPYAQDYIDSGFKSIKKDNIEEMVGLGMNSSQYRQFKSNLSKVSNTSDKNGFKQYIDDNNNVYWYDSDSETMFDKNYNKTTLTEDDLTKVSKTEESLNYINSLDLTDTQKNIAANNLNKNSKKTIDMSAYGNYSSYDEYKYARDYPEKYSVSSQIADYDSYIKYKDDINEIKKQYSTELGYESKERKTAVQSYINGLNLNTYQKMMLEKMAGGYSIKNYQNYIYEYLEQTDLTRSEKFTIWEELFN